jgi:uridine phosphorylase
METTHIFHLAASYKKSPIIHPPPEPPLATGPVVPSASGVSHQDVSAATSDVGSPIIRAAAAHMVFASRGSGGFITPEQVATVEAWATRGVLEALASFTVQVRDNT